MERIKQIALWFLIIAYLFGAMGFVYHKKSEYKCTSIDVFIKNEEEGNYIGKRDLRIYLNETNPEILGSIMQELDIQELEKNLYRRPEVKYAAIYRNLSGRLIVETEVRIPLIRVFEADNDNFYIDTEGKIMPVISSNPTHLIVVNGHIDFGMNDRILSDPDSLQIAEIKNKSLFNELLTLSGYIKNNHFFNAQIEQIYVNEFSEFELVPKVGSQLIIIGKPDNLEWKFKKLYAVYKYGFAKMGWEKYKTINLKYSNQVVCTKF